MSFVVSGNEQAVSCHENIMVFGHFTKFQHFIMSIICKCNSRFRYFGVVSGRLGHFRLI